MKSKKKIIILCSIVLVAILVIFGVWTVKSGCFDHLLLNKQQRHEELLTILIKATEKEHFLSQLEHWLIWYFVEKKNDKDVVLFQNGYAEFVNGDILCWAYHNAQCKNTCHPGRNCRKVEKQSSHISRSYKTFWTSIFYVL